jgi:hypothetical protein
LGADDRLLPHFVGLARGLAAAHSDAAWLHTGAIVIDENGAVATPLADRVKRATMPRITGSRTMGGEDLAVSLLRGNWMYFPSVVFRRAWLQQHGFRSGYDIVQDLDLYLRILFDGGHAVLSGRPGIEYRRHPASLSSAGAGDGTRFAEEKAFFTETAAVATAAGWHRAARAARRHWTARLHALTTVPALLRAGHRDSAGAMLRMALTAVSRHDKHQERARRA